MRFEPGEDFIPGVRLRDATAADERFLKGLYRSVRAAELAVVPWSDAQKAAFADTQFDLQARAYRAGFPDARCFVIERDGAAIGRLYLDASPGELRVMDVTLSPDARSKGLGTALLGRLQAMAAEEGACVALHVEAHSRARALYSRLGFVEEGEEGVYIAMRWVLASCT